ncbi:SPOR domain-containing protein [Loktanella sp. F6476L]|uniref:SPOR domain-containing protein n=1 Tax=Loktanella sp. F6476L TaxID=2926405 RepID=UPI001FF668F2|nr:SPOR domain-containing protein [Loktanella sp. F6476L]MCK0121560.1 SPOR domain-containing protein [Loktanella sp. F6476L]
MAIYDERDQSQSFVQSGSLMNYAGAAVSLALVVGVSVWGYQLIMRDVSGIPVVRAMEGAMRVAPQAPGGEIASHAGLSVNDVAGIGEAAGPSDSLLLAPATPGLAEEDLRVEPLAEAGEVLPATDVTPSETQIPTALETAVTTDTEEPLTTEGILALADQIAGTAAPLTALADGEDVAPTVTVDGAEVASAPAVDPAVPGVSTSLRPTVRPRRATPAAVTTTAPAAAAPQVADTSTAVAAALAEATVATNGALPVGTNLVQLGAFPSADTAAAEWTRMSSLFSDYMGDKTRVIQEASSGGSTFYRLRASGFTEAADARRFCATLQAANTDCIPVVVR